MRQGGRCYAYRKGPDGKNIYLHRYLTGVIHGQLVDHRDRDTLNYRSDNLRPATYSDNNRNRHRPKSNSSGYLGVRRDATGNKWIAVLTTDTKRRHLGTFDDPVLAAICRDLHALREHGDFASLNFEPLREAFRPVKPSGPASAIAEIPTKQRTIYATAAA